MSIKSYLVKRAHEGDRLYAEGETRQASEADVRHLVPHVLEEIGTLDAKAEKRPRNKAKGPAPANKSNS